jgi:hypothetical protein
VTSTVTVGRPSRALAETLALGAVEQAAVAGSYFDQARLARSRDWPHVFRSSVRLMLAHMRAAALLHEVAEAVLVYVPADPLDLPPGQDPLPFEFPTVRKGTDHADHADPVR